MTPAQLTAFLAAMDHGSFTAAARELGGAQASMSELVARLEREVGAALFVRGGRRLVPTAAALELQPHARRAIGALDAGLDAVRSLSALEGGTCTFGVLRNAAYYDLADLVQRFHAQHPKVVVRLVGLNSALVAESIVRGELEAGIVVLPVAEEGLSVRPLFRDEVLYASTSRHPDAGAVTIDELASASLVLYDAYAGWSDPTRRQLRERASLRGLRIEPSIEVEHVETALGLVAAGSVDTVVSRSIAESPTFPAGVHVTPMAEPCFDTIALVQREGAHLSPATRAIASLAERILLSKLRHHEGRERVG